MRVLNVIRARSVWLINLDELNPEGKSIQRDELVEWLDDIYDFEKVPDLEKEIDAAQGLVFTGGKFSVNNKESILVNLTIYPDGIVAETISSTHDTDGFVQNLIEQGVAHFGLRYDPSFVRRRLYLSELNVHCDNPFLSKMSLWLSGFTQKISGLIPEVRDIPFEVASIGFWPDPRESAPFVITPFRFERKVGSGFEESRYYSCAPLHTDDHIALLQEFENQYTK